VAAKSDVALSDQQCIKSNSFAYRGAGGGGGGRFAFANPTQVTMPIARITHPSMSYFVSLFFFFF